MDNNCSGKCGECGVVCDKRTQPQVSSEKPRVKNVIGVVSGKGGVGKSLVCTLLACSMNKKGYNVAVLDADITGPSVPKMFGISQKAVCTEDGILPVKTQSGIDTISINMLLNNDTDPVIWRGPIIANTVKQFWTDVLWENVDFMFVDMPPGTGDVPLTVFKSLPIDGIIVVTFPQELVGMIVEKAVNMAEKMNVPVLGFVENMSYFECPTCRDRHYIFGNSHLEHLAAEYGVAVTARIPILPELAASCDGGKVESVNAEWLSGIIAEIENKTK